LSRYFGIYKGILFLPFVLYLSGKTGTNLPLIL
jgi:hypothetical protein